MFTAKLTIHPLESDGDNFCEVVESIPHDQSDTYEGLDMVVKKFIITHIKIVTAAAIDLCKCH
jgi:hypothetical protein